MNKEQDFNVLKVRDDSIPLRFIKDNGNKDSKIFKVIEDNSATWCPDGTFGISDLRSRIEPWLTSLFQSEHLSLLVGNGLTTAIHSLVTEKTNNPMGQIKPASSYADNIEEHAKKSAEKFGRGANPNIEDYIRIMNELLRGLEILNDKDKHVELKTEIDLIIKTFVESISANERIVADPSMAKSNEALEMLVMFLMSFASRTGTRDRLNIFTTNYDRLIEAGADIAGLRLLDRFVGSLAPIFRSSRLDIDMHYNPPGIRGEPRYLEGVARYTKLHGSIDWVEDTNGNIRKIALPFGSVNIDQYSKVPGLADSSSKIMIYPNSSKDRETSEYPYVELFRDFAAALCRPNSTLVTYGYSFGDDHINRIIKDMLTIPSTHLVVIAYSDNGNRIKKFYGLWKQKPQISIILGKDIASIGNLVEYYLPKPAIDRTTIRMAELLRQRYEQSNEVGKQQTSDGKSE